MSNPRAASIKTQLVGLMPKPLVARLRKARGQFEYRARKAKKTSKNQNYRRAIRASLDQTLDEHKVFYESFDGNGALCNPRAIFDQLSADSSYSNFRHVWSVTEQSLPEVRKAIGHRSNVSFVIHKTERYFKELHSAKYIITNSTFPHEFNKREGQVYLNTWHGTPLKKMGYDAPGGNISARNVIRNFLAADYLLSSNSYMSHEMYEKSYKLRGIFSGKIIETGSPRIDKQFMTQRQRQDCIDELIANGLSIDSSKKTIVYAPTWKGNSVYSPINNVDRLKLVVDQMKTRPDLRDVNILIKAHQLVYRQGQEDPELARILIPNHIETNRILGITDLLITDYSSIFFDYLQLGGPIVFYAPDLRGYEKVRGMYFDMDDLPGVLATTHDELIEAVEQGLGGDSTSSKDETRSVWQQKYTNHEDGRATGRVIDIVFGGSSSRDLIDLSATDKVKILMYPGGMLNNGITRAVHNLLDSIDYSKYDVTLTAPTPKSGDRRTNLERVNSNCRIIPRVGGVRSVGYEKSVYDGYLNRGNVASADETTLDGIFDREWFRMFGEAKFDVIIDFDGYSAFNAGLLSHGNSKSKVIWGHNDLIRDSQREVNGKKIFEAQFRSIFSMYKHFDYLVSVTSDLSKIHAHELASYFPQDRFITVSNFLETEFIKTMAYGSTEYSGDSVGVRANNLSGGVSAGDDRSAVDGSLDSVLGVAINSYGWEQVLEVLERKRLVHDFIRPEEGYTNFVTTGRLSPEKNQQLLIESFASVHEEYPFTRLIIVGDGPLRKDLENVTHALGVSHSVVFAGHQSNPFPIVANSDCFVFSSNYEGQGLSLLEALVLDVPVVTTEYNVVHSVLPAGTGLITEPTVAGLADGMRAFLSGGVPNAPFDTCKYNEQARTEFDEMIALSLDALSVR